MPDSENTELAEAQVRKRGYSSMEEIQEVRDLLYFTYQPELKPINQSIYPRNRTPEFARKAEFFRKLK